MVVCAVKLCRNYTGKNIKPPEGISFHRFPTDPDQKQEWIQAIRRAPDWVPGTHCRVCSVHFDNTDFKISETGRRILHKDAVPTKNLYQEERQDTMPRVVRKTRKTARETLAYNTISEDLQACRVCLNTDVTLHDLCDKGLDQIFQDLSNIQVSSTDGLPQQICNICTALLQKYEAFRARCHAAHDLLEEARNRQDPITTEYIRSIDRDINQLSLPLSVKKLRIIDLTEIIIKQEHLDFTIPLDDIADDNNDDDFDIFDEKNDQKIFEDVKEENEQDDLNDNRSHTEIYASETPKHEIFVEVNTKKKLRSETKKRKSELKKKSKKIKKEEPPQSKNATGVRKTKPRKTDEDYENFSKMYNVDIIFLSREEQIAEVQARKDSDNYKNSRFKCDQCFKGFTSEGAFKNHQDIHDPALGSHVCEPCGSRFSKRRQLLHHLTQHKMNLVCKLCNHVTKLLSKAKEHFKWHNGVKYPCHYCDKSFIKRTSQFNHMRNRHGSTACDICQEIFSGERGLSAHMQKAHREAVKSRCETCGVQFYSEAARTRHLEALPGNVCDPNMRSAWERLRKYNRVMGSSNNPRIYIKINCDHQSACQAWACGECGDNYISEELLNEHMKENHWKEIKCDKCNANFENEKLYKMHRIIHKEYRNRKPRSEKDRLPKGAKLLQNKLKAKKVAKIQKRMCEMCGLTWRSSAALKYHQRVHTGEKPHQCPVCPKSFRIQDSLQIHMNTHTGARPFKCPHCPKAFKSRTQNHKHQLVHTKVRRYRCDLCDKTFQTSTCVKTHIKTVHMKIPAPPRARNRPPLPLPRPHDLYNMAPMPKMHHMDAV